MALIFDDLVARTFQETTLLLQDNVFPAAILIRVVDQENFHAISTSGHLKTALWGRHSHSSAL